MKTEKEQMEKTMQGYRCLYCNQGRVIKNKFGYWCNDCQRYYKKVKKEDI